MGPRHAACGKQIAKVITLRTAQPICPTCPADKRQELCQAAVVAFLGRGRQQDRFRIRLPSGNATRRRQDLFARIRRGATGIR